MYREALLVRIALLHAAFLAAASAAGVVTGLPVRGLALGGGAMALSLVLIWAMARLTLAARPRWLAVVASLKILLYLSLLTATLTGRLVADGAGFAVGITCFVVATLAVVTLSPRAREFA
jgi:hypothetical protein